MCDVSTAEFGSQTDGECDGKCVAPSADECGFFSACEFVLVNMARKQLVKLVL